MGIWSRLEKTFVTGDTVEDHGVISDRRIGRAVRRTISVELAGRHGRRVFIRVLNRRLFSATWNFVELDRDAASKLHAALEDALAKMWHGAGGSPAGPAMSGLAACRQSSDPRRAGRRRE